MASSSRNNTSAAASTTTMSSATIPTNRPQRSYNTRSSTVSVTQLLSDSCSSFLNRIASRVRGPSVNLESATARNRRSKGPNSTGGSARDKHTSTATAGSSTSSHVAAATGSTSTAGTYTPRHSISHNDLSPRPAHSSRHSDTRKLDNSYWNRTSREDIRDAKRNWLAVPESKTSISANTNSSRTTNSHRTNESTKHRDPLDWKYRSFAGASTTPDYYGKSNKSLYGDGDLCSSASVSDIRSSGSGAKTSAHYLGSTRSRLEDKYYDRLYANSSTSGGSSSYVAYKQRPLTKSATSVILSEKAYPYVSTASSSHQPTAAARRGKTRDTTTTTTPYRETIEKTAAARSENRHKSSSRRETVLYTFKPLRGEDRNQSRHRLQSSSSCKDFSRLRADSPHVSANRSPAATTAHTSKSEKRSMDKSLAVKPTPSIPTIAVESDVTTATTTVEPAGIAKSKTTATLAPENGKTLNTDRVSSSETSDREIKRKEIQALIEKYAGLDEQTSSQELPSALVKCQKKYSAVLSNTTAPAGLVDIYHSPVAVAAAKAVSVTLCRLCSIFSFSITFAPPSTFVLKLYLRLLMGTRIR